MAQQPPMQPQQAPEETQGQESGGGSIEELLSNLNAGLGMLAEIMTETNPQLGQMAESVKQSFNEFVEVLTNGGKPQQSGPQPMEQGQTGRPMSPATR